MKSRTGLAVAAAAAVAAFQAEAKLFRAAGFEPAVYYTGERPIERGDASADLAIVFVHGWGGGADDRTALYRRVCRKVAKRGAKPVAFAPMFPIRRYFREKKIPDDGRAAWCGFWEVGEEGSAANDWRGGGDAYGTEISSFDVIDRMVETLCDRKLFPSVRRIVVAGFSAGGQVVARYAAVGKCPAREGVTVEYASIAPAFYLKLDENEPWHYGLKNVPRYAAAMKKSDILANLSARRVWFGCGTKDDERTNGRNRLAARQGESRYDRHLKFAEYVKGFPSWAAMTSFHDIPGVGHTGKVWDDPQFLDFIAGRPAVRAAGPR